MKINYGSPAYFFYLAVAVGFIFLLYKLFAKRSRRAQDILLFSLMGINILQHFFKFLVWPHLWGTEPNITNTAYNVCAFLILISPLIYQTNCNVAKEFLTYFGTGGGFFALLIPFWFIGQTMWQWEFIRSFFCHTLLVTTSILPALFGRVHFQTGDGWKFAPIFFVMQGIILLDNVVCIACGLYPAGKGFTMMECLKMLNPLWMICPPQNFGFFEQIVRVITPAFLLDPYIPILWYAIPLGFTFTICSYPVGLVTQALERRAKCKNLSYMRIKDGLCARENLFLINAPSR